MTIAERKFIQEQKSAEILRKAKDFSLGDIQYYYATVRALFSAKRPWAHRTKKGPGRKHQQTKTMTNLERNPVEQHVS